MVICFSGPDAEYLNKHVFRASDFGRYKPVIK